MGLLDYERCVSSPLDPLALQVDRIRFAIPRTCPLEQVWPSRRLIQLEAPLRHAAQWRSLRFSPGARRAISSVHPILGPIKREIIRSRAPQ